MKKLKIIFVITISIFMLVMFALNIYAASDKWYEKPEITLKFANANAWSTNNVKAGAFFEQRVKELTHGRVAIQYYPAGALGMNERAFAEQLQDGTLDLVHLATGSFSTMVPELRFFGLFYANQSPAHFYRITASPIGILGWYCCAMRSIFLKDKPIYKPEDLKGVKVRVMEDEMMINSFKALGASPVPLAYGEVYTALQTGVIDAAENHPTVYIGQKFYEPAPYYSLTEHMGCPCMVAISVKTWNKLDKEAQDAILQAEQEASAWLRGYNVYDIPRALKFLEDQGIKVNKVEKGPFIELMKPLLEKYIPQIIGEELYEIYKAIPTEPELAWDEDVYLYEK